ncbi:MlaD family protein [bacterium]|nr:MlaD family protein [bacterium]MDB4388001.1 MlaD family protein [Akkermansiaceae bacterium]MDB4467257.1 MlaD family protein [Akkermansiaceae bacterium]
MKDSTNTGSTKPAVSRDRKISKVWIIPILGLFLGIWLVNRSVTERGELVTVSFENAEGLAVDKTEVRCRSVKIGKVESIKLDPKDLTVSIGMRINSEHVALVRKQSKFWVVRPRITGAGISGLGTLLSGAYIELDPGQPGEEKFSFIGEEQPPLTPSTVPGLRLSLISEMPGSIDLGSGIYFMENKVGKVESRFFDPNLRITEFGIFIEERFAQLVNSETRFWRDNGIDLKVDTSGFQLELPSLDSLVSGRINFGVPDGLPDGFELPSVVNRFTLFEDTNGADADGFKSAADLLILVEEQVRGLNPGAPVEFRGLRVGRVSEISYQLVSHATVEKTPVLIQLNDDLLKRHFPEGLRDEGLEGIKEAFAQGLRASLKTSNVLTGQLYVDLDYYPDIPPTEIVQIDDCLIIPSVETGFGRLEDSVAELLKKLNDLEVEPLLAEFTDAAKEATNTMRDIQDSLGGTDEVLAETKLTMTQAKEMMTALNEVMNSTDTKALPGDIRLSLAQLNKSMKPFSNEGAVYGDLLRTMDELRKVTRSIDRMTTEIADKPNSLIFGKDPNSKKIPRARR